LKGDIKVADEVWVACALLHNEKPQRTSFSDSELLNRVKQESIFGSIRVGIQWHISLHCVANKPANPDRHRMLYELPDGTKRLYKMSDPYHFTREEGKVAPEPCDIPEQYRYLIKWYWGVFNKAQKGCRQELPYQETNSIESPLIVRSVIFSSENDLKKFSYDCPAGVSSIDIQNGFCKKCPLCVEEDEVKKAISAKLKAEGWVVNKTALGQMHGVDIEAIKRPNEIILIEAKGEGSLNPMRVNYFLMVIGEIVQRMDSAHKQYGIGLPAHKQYINLIEKLPLWIKQQLRLKIFLIKRQDGGEYVVGYLAY
jgi:hypothetical protein